VRQWFKTSRTLSIPSTVPPGSYCLGAFNRSVGDSLGQNNSSWLDRQIAVQQPCASDGYEYDGSSSWATVLNQGVSQFHSVCGIGDQDWLRFTLTGDSGVSLQTSGINGDTRLAVYDQCLSMVRFDDDGGSGYFSRIDLDRGRTAFEARPR
jgi:hypothetical protein